MIDIKRIAKDDDLAAVAASIKGDEWGKDNELDDYDEAALRQMTASPDSLLLIAYKDGRPVGLVVGMMILKPYGTDKHWLYIDEVDTHPDYRRQGVGHALMEKTLACAKEMGADEMWLGTELDNDAANALYASFKPTEVETFTGYTYKIE